MRVRRWRRPPATVPDEALADVDRPAPPAAASVPGAAAPQAIRVRPLGPDEVAAAEALLDATMAGRHQARLGEQHDVLALPGFAAWDGDELVGLATWTDEQPEAELAVLAVRDDRRSLGIGGTLLEWVAAAGRKLGTQTLWLVTTNDNLEALALYQRHAFRLVGLRAGGLDEARAFKPQMPAVGRHGIPLHDELILERRL